MVTKNIVKEIKKIEVNLKQVRTGRPFLADLAIEDRMEIALAWIKGEVSLTQIAKYRSISPMRMNSVYTYMATGVKEAYKRGLIRMK